MLRTASEKFLRGRSVQARKQEAAPCLFARGGFVVAGTGDRCGLRKRYAAKRRTSSWSTSTIFSSEETGMNSFTPCMQ